MTTTTHAVHNAFKMFGFETHRKAKAKARAKERNVKMLQEISALVLTPMPAAAHHQASAEAEFLRGQLVTLLVDSAVHPA